jgi:3-methyladenine DNA glycosylase/8-oxoguanine DNA glycosylase
MEQFESEMSEYTKALSHLRKADPVIARVIDAVGPCRLQVRADGTHFDALVRAIVYQQLSGKAAATIHGRVRALYGDRDPTPEELLATPEEKLRGAGLSRQKLGYIRDLAARVASGDVPLDHVHTLDDDTLTEALVRVKGIGKWTAQMFLIFRLGRPNVLPDLDLGIQNGIRRAYGLRKQPKPKDVLKIGARWAPHASVAAWYLWRVLELPAWDTATRDVGSTVPRPSARRTVTRDGERGKRAASSKRAPTSDEGRGTRKGGKAGKAGKHSKAKKVRKAASARKVSSRARP